MPSKHYQSVLVNHVQSYQPDSSVKDSVQNSPGVALDVQLLYRRAVSSSLVAYCVDVPASERAAVRTPDSLLESWKGSLVHRADLELFTLLQVLTFQGTSDDVHKIFELGNSKVNSVIHHFTEGLESLGGDVEEEDLRTWNISAPVKLVGLVASDNQDVGLVNDNYLSLADLLVKNFEASPL